MATPNSTVGTDSIKMATQDAQRKLAILKDGDGEGGHLANDVGDEVRV